MTTTIKITELTNIGANLASSTVIPVVNMGGTPTTEKTVLGNIANVVLAGAGGNYVAAAKATTATTANTVLTNAQPNITSVGNLTGLTVSNATGVVNFSNTANVTLGNVSNLHIAGGTAGQLLSTNGNGTLSWASDTTTYGNSNVVSLLSAFGSNTITTTGNVSVGNIIGNGQALTNIAGANVSGFVPNANVSNTAFSVAAANVSGLGNIATINLTGSTSNVLYGNGVFAAVAGGANTGNVTFDDVTVQGVNGLNLSAGADFTANLAYLQVRSGDVASHIHFDTGNNNAYDLIVGDDQKFVQVSSTGNIIMSSYDGNISYAMTLDTTGMLTVPGTITRPVDDTLTLVTSGSNGNSSSIGIDGEFGRTLLRTYDGTTLNTWEFDITGNLDLPVGGDLNFNGGGITQAINDDLNIVVQDEEDDGWSLLNTITDSLGNNLSQTQLDRSSFTIRTDMTGTNNQWQFDGNTLQVSNDSTVRGFASNVVLQSMSSGTGGTASLQSVSNQNDPNIFSTFDATTTGANIKVYNGGSNGGVGYTWQFANDGKLTFPGTPRIDTDANNFEVQAAEAINFEANTVVNIYTDAGNNAYQWQFGDDGNLTLPGNIIGPAGANFTLYSNAAAHEFIFGDDGTFYAPDNVVLGGNSIYIGPGANTLSGIEHEVFIASSNLFPYVQAVVNNISDQGSADWVALGAKGGDAGGQTSLGFTSSGFADANYTITGHGDGYVLVQSYALGQTLLGGGGNLVLATGNNGTTKDIIFGTGGFLSSNIFGRISDANNALELSRTNSNLSLSGGGGIIGDGNLYLYPDSGNLDGRLDIYLTTGPDIHIAGVGENLILGRDDTANVTVGVNGNVSIQATTGNAYTWTFDNTGNLNVPGNIVGPAGANFTIYSNAAVHEFIFADDGTFYAPDDVVLGGNSIYIGPGANSLTGLEHAVLIASSNHFPYIQGVINNVSDNGSADWVAQGHFGDDDGGWTDFGFTSGGFNDANYTITGPGDGYLFVESYAPGQLITGPKGGNLIIATGNQGTVKDIIFGTGGFLTGNIFGRISHANNSLELSRTGATITFPDATEQNTAWTGSVTTIANGNSNVNIATSNGNIVITSAGTNSWNFDSTGNLTIPGSSGGFIKTVANASIGIAAVDNGTNNPAQLLSMTNAGAATSIISAYATNATIQTNATGTLNTWQFDNAGNLTLPTGGQIIVSGGLVSSGASPAPTINGFSITNSVGISGNGNIAGNNISATGNVTAQGVGTNMVRRANTISGSNTAVTLDNLTALVGGTPKRLYIGAATSNMTMAGQSQTMSTGALAVSSWINVPIVTGTGNGFAMSGAITNDGDTAVLNVTDQGAGSGTWRVTGMIANTSANLYSVSIERLA